MIEFFDYQCIFCYRISSTIEKLHTEHLDVRFLYKESPIFGSRWEASKYAAQMGLWLFASYGSEAYDTFHNGVFKSGKNEGKLTVKDVNQAATSAGADVSQFTATEYYQKNLQLFSQVGFKGTPGLIVMPSQGASLENIYVINGADASALESAIKSVKANLN